MAVSNCSKYFHRMLKSIAETPFVRSLGREDASLRGGRTASCSVLRAVREHEGCEDSEYDMRADDSWVRVLSSAGWET